MEKTWRWFGPDDRITPDMLRQIGVEGIVTALHEIPNGYVWPESLSVASGTSLRLSRSWTDRISIGEVPDVSCSIPWPQHRNIQRSGPAPSRSLHRDMLPKIQAAMTLSVSSISSVSSGQYTNKNHCHNDFAIPFWRGRSSASPFILP